MNTIFVLMPMVKAHSTIKLEKSSLVNYLNMLGFGFDFSLKEINSAVTFLHFRIL